jgi:NodT family efflux transporter outer membrane factor (OMF) lipoprotein
VQWAETAGVDTRQPTDVAWWRKLDDPVLLRCVEKALSDNQDLQAAQSRVRQARALRSAAAGALLPSLAAAAGYAHSQGSETTVMGPFLKAIDVLEQDLYQAGFDASWEIDLFGGGRRALEAAATREEAAREGYRDVLVSVAAETARNYVELRGAQRLLAVAEENSALQRETLRLVESVLAAKLGSQLEVEQARAQLEQTLSAIPPLHATIRAAAYAIAVLTGEPPAALLQELLATRPLPDPPDMVPVGLPSDLLRRRPDVRQAERSLHVATADIGVATADLFPRFFLTGAASRQSAQFTDVFRAGSLAWSLGPSVSWPVFQGGRIRAHIALTEARRDELLANYRQTVLAALKDVETALVRYAQRQVERERLAASCAAQAKAVAMAHVQYRNGLQNFLVVLDAERRLNDIESALALAETRVVSDLISLYKALGGGWEETLGVAGEANTGNGGAGSLPLGERQARPARSHAAESRRASDDHDAFLPHLDTGLPEQP